MRVQLEAGEIGHPDERGGIAWYYFLGASARRETKRHDLDPRRPRLRCTLLIEEVAVNAIWITHEDVWPPTCRPQRSVSDSKVVTHEIQFGVAGVREQHLTRVRDGDLAIVNEHKLLVGFAGHDWTTRTLRLG